MKLKRYNFPEKRATKKGFFFAQNIKFVEIIRDPCLDRESEIDFDFNFLENICIPVIKGRKETELFITLNLN
jgi:hypothetical protein